MLNKIEQVLDEKVRPVLQNHGGGLELISYEDGICKIRLTGQCAGCPSAMLTNEEIIKENLIESLPEIRDVVVVQETSEELLDFARKILEKKRNSK